MYVGPWQEYKLMKVIADMQDERDRFREEMESISYNSQHIITESNNNKYYNDYIGNVVDSNNNNNNNISNSTIYNNNTSIITNMTDGLSGERSTLCEGNSNNYYNNDVAYSNSPELCVVHRKNVNGTLVHLDRRNSRVITEHAFDTYPPGHYCAPQHQNYNKNDNYRHHHYHHHRDGNNIKNNPTIDVPLTREERATLALLPQVAPREQNVHVHASLDINSLARLAGRRLVEDRVRESVRRGVYYVASEHNNNDDVDNDHNVNNSLTSSTDSSSSPLTHNSCSMLRNVNLRKRAEDNAMRGMRKRIERRKKLQALYTQHEDADNVDSADILERIDRKEKVQKEVENTGSSEVVLHTLASLPPNVRANHNNEREKYLEENYNNQVRETEENNKNVEMELDEAGELTAWADMLNIDEIDAM